MGQKPRKKGSSIFEGMTSSIALMGMLGGVAAIIAFLYGYGTSLMSGDVAFAETKARTMALTALVLFQLVLVFNCRDPAQSLLRGGLFSNKWLFSAVALSFVMQLAIVYVPFLQPLFGTCALTLSDWVMIVAVAGFATTPFLGNMWAKKESG